MKKNFKLLVSFILTVIATIVFGTTIVNAENIASSVTIKSTSYHNPPMSYPQTFHVKKTTGGKFAYCITYAKKTPSTGIKYTKADIVDDAGKHYILKQAYQNVRNNNDFFVYQTALWIYMSDKGIMNKSYSVSKFRNKVYSSNSATAKKIRTLVANAKKAPKPNFSGPSIKLSPDKSEMSKSGSNYVSKKIKVTSSEKKFKVSLVGAPKGSTYKVSGKYIYVYVPDSKIKPGKTTLKVKVSNSKEIIKSQNYNPSNSRYQKMAVTYKNVKNAEDTAKLIINKKVSVNVPVNKTDFNTKSSLKGAVIEAKNSSGKVIDRWTSNGSTHVIKNLNPGTYTVGEVSAPNGYNLNKNKITFVIDNDGNIKVSGQKVSSITITNVKSPKVVKIDADTKTAVKGAVLKITDSNNKEVDRWTTDGSEHTVKSLAQGTYTLSEVSAPDGYILSKETIKFTVDASGNTKNTSGTNVTKLELKNTKNSVKISKQDITTNKELPGASLELKDKNGKVIDKWTSTDKEHLIRGLAAGTYTLSETISPKGYVLSKETISFTIDKNGKLTDKNGKTIDKVVMYNTPEKERNIEISKQDITTKKELPGATLQVKDKNNKVIDTWVSTNESHIIKYIEAGTYTLTETVAPNGYILSKETIKFTVDKDGKLTDESGKSIDKVVMYNKPSEEKNITISKQDITTKKELPGASLKVVDKDNKIIDTWISTNEPHIIKNIEAGTYTLTETVAPNGYILSKETIKFTVDKNGKLTDESGKSIDKVVMYNKPNEEKNIKISKKDITTNKELPGAKLKLANEKGVVIDEWTSTTEEHIIKNIEAGNYILSEVSAPNGYVLNTDSIKFTVDKTGKITDSNGNTLKEVVMFNKPIPKTNVTISKQDITTSKELPGATLQVKDNTGKIIDTWVSTNEAHVIKDLPEGTYTLTETIAPDGYVLSKETITFKIDSKGTLLNKDDKAIDKVVMYNEKKPTPEQKKYPIVKIDAKTNENLAGASLEIKDKDGKVVDSWVTDKNAHYVELVEGSYTLSETKAPNGYILSNETIKFTVSSDGKLLDEAGKELNTVIMKNTPNTTTKVSISKQDVTTSKELPGAKLVVKDKNGNVIDEWTSGDTPHIITNLTPGTYTLNEVVAPNGYVLSNETITFTVKDDGTTTKVIMYNKPETPNTPEQPDTPDTPSTPGKEITVENTGSWASTIPSVIGSLSLGAGAFTIIRKKKSII